MALPDLTDPAYIMSMPSQNPLDELGYTQYHKQALDNPIAMLNWDPSYHIYPESGLTAAIGQVNPINKKTGKRFRWDYEEDSTKKGAYGKAEKAMTKYIRKNFKGKEQEKMMQDAIYFQQALRGEGLAFSPTFEKRLPNADQIQSLYSDYGKKGNIPMHEEMHKGFQTLALKNRYKNKLPEAKTRGFNTKDTAAWDHNLINLYYSKYGTDWQKKEAKTELLGTYDNMKQVERLYGRRLEVMMDAAKRMFPDNRYKDDTSTFEKALKILGINKNAK